jgi:CRP-like cAMP-binding protein
MVTIRELATKDWDFSQNLLNIISKQHTETLSKLTSMTRSPLEKTGRYLLNLKLNKERCRFKLPYLKFLIAPYLGITPETFSRSLAKLKNSGIKIEGNELVLESEYSLCDFCELAVVSKCKHYESPDCKWAS